MMSTIQLKLLRRGSIVLGILFILAALNFFPWEILFHKYGASGLAYENFVERRADTGRNVPEILEAAPLDDQLPEAVIAELHSIRLSEDNLRQLGIARNLIHRDVRAGAIGLFYYIAQTLLWTVVFILGFKLIALGRGRLEPTESERTLSEISVLRSRLEEVERRLGQ